MPIHGGNIRCNYNGRFDVNKQRIGSGTEQYYVYNEPETYEGRFFRDSYHGQGSYYTKPVFGSSWSYEGSFYANAKDGVGLLSYGNNTYFIGLFKDDEAFGPGIWTESNGGQNIGFWKGTSLVRLTYPVGEVKQLATNSYNKIRVLRYRRLVNAKEEIRDYGVETLEKVNASPNLMLLSDRLHGIYCKIPQSHLFMKKQFDDVYMDDLILSDALFALIRSVSITTIDQLRLQLEGLEATESESFSADYSVSRIRRKTSSKSSGSGTEETIFTESQIELKPIPMPKMQNKKQEMAKTSAIFSKQKSGGADLTDVDTPYLMAWNNSQIMVDMLTHTFKNRNAKCPTSLNIGLILCGRREQFDGRKGYLEVMSKKFLKACSAGQIDLIKELAYTWRVDVNLTDSNGNSCLLRAVETDNHPLIKLLILYGADPDILNDEGFSTITHCLTRYLTIKRKIKNWGDAFLPPTDFGPNPSVKQWMFENKSSKRPSLVSTFTGKKFHPSTKERYIFDFTPQEPGDPWIEIFRILGEKEKLNKAVKPKKQIKKKKKKKTTDKDTVSIKANLDNNSEKNSIESRVEEIPENLRLSVKSPLDYGDDEVVKNKLEIIKKTIALLTRVGGNLNISEVPAPVILLAILTGMLEIVETLLKQGVNPNARLLKEQKNGNLTPLHVMVLTPPLAAYPEILSVLLKYGADTSLLTSEDFEMEAQEFLLRDLDRTMFDPVRGLTPIQLLCLRVDGWNSEEKIILQEMLRILIPASIDSFRPAYRYLGHTPLSLAISKGNSHFVQVLLEADNIVDPNEDLGKHLTSPLGVFMRYLGINPLLNSYRMLANLLNVGANPLRKLYLPDGKVGNLFDSLKIYHTHMIEKFFQEMINEGASVLTEFALKDKKKKKKKKKEKKKEEQNSKPILSREYQLKNAEYQYKLAILENISRAKLDRRIRGRLLKELLLKIQNNMKKVESHTALLIMRMRLWFTPEAFVNTVKEGVAVGNICLNKEEVDIALSILFPVIIKKLKHSRKDLRTLKKLEKQQRQMKQDVFSQLENTIQYCNELRDDYVGKETKLRQKYSVVTSRNLDLYPELDPSGDLYKVCYTCLERNQPLRVCPRCGLVYFCCELCNMLDVLKENPTGHNCLVKFYGFQKVEYLSQASIALLREPMYSNFYGSPWGRDKIDINSIIEVTDEEEFLEERSEYLDQYAEQEERRRIIMAEKVERRIAFEKELAEIRAKLEAEEMAELKRMEIEKQQELLKEKEESKVSLKTEQEVQRILETEEDAKREERERAIQQMLSYSQMKKEDLTDILKGMRDNSMSELQTMSDQVLEVRGEFSDEKLDELLLQSLLEETEIPEKEKETKDEVLFDREVEFGTEGEKDKLYEAKLLKKKEIEKAKQEKEAKKEKERLEREREELERQEKESEKVRRERREKEKAKKEKEKREREQEQFLEKARKEKEKQERELEKAKKKRLAKLEGAPRVRFSPIEDTKEKQRSLMAEEAVEAVDQEKEKQVKEYLKKIQKEKEEEEVATLKDIEALEKAAIQEITEMQKKEAEAVGGLQSQTVSSKEKPVPVIITDKGEIRPGEPHLEAKEDVKDTKTDYKLDAVKVLGKKPEEHVRAEIEEQPEAVISDKKPTEQPVSERELPLEAAITSPTPPVLAPGEILQPTPPKVALTPAQLPHVPVTVTQILKPPSEELQPILPQAVPTEPDVGSKIEASALATSSAQPPVQPAAPSPQTFTPPTPIPATEIAQITELQTPTTEVVVKPVSQPPKAKPIKAPTPALVQPAPPSVKATAHVLPSAKPTTPEPYIAKLPAPTVPYTEPPAPAPPLDLPPAIAPPVSEPFVQVPPVTQPPALAPTLDLPPAPAPPVSVPSAQVPLLTQPPALAPPVTKPPVAAPQVPVPSVQVPAAMAPTLDLPPTPAPPVSIPSAQVPLVTQPPTLTPPVTKPPVPAPQVPVPSAQIPPVTQAPPVAKPPAPAPPIAKPPAPAPPVSVPSAQVPLVTQPPALAPPVTKPPVPAPQVPVPYAQIPLVTQAPPVSVPSAQVPLVTQPPALAPQVAKPPVPAPPISVPSPQIPLVTQPPALTPLAAKPPAPAPPVSVPSAQVPLVKKRPSLAPPEVLKPAPIPPVTIPPSPLPPAVSPLVQVPKVSELPASALPTALPPSTSPPFAKPPAPAPAVSVPSAQVPLVTQPPAPAPPVSVPSAQVPFVTQPPALAPPVAKPPAPAPPVSVPSAQVPFVTQPPALAPPVAMPPAPAPIVSIPSTQVPLVTQPPALAPPVAKPPVPAPPVPVPSAQVPFVTQPPALAPPVVKPPAPVPPVSVPPAQVPFVTQPPALAPPVVKPPAPVPPVSVPSALVTKPPALAPPVAKPPMPAPPVSLPSAQVPFVTQPPALAPPVAKPPAPAPPVPVPSAQVPLVTQPLAKPPVPAPPVSVPSAQVPLVTQPHALAPPVAKPPVSAPPVSVPSVQIPLVTQPPALAPPEVMTLAPTPPFSELPAPAPPVTLLPSPLPQAVTPPAPTPIVSEPSAAAVPTVWPPPVAKPQMPAPPVSVPSAQVPLVTQPVAPAPPVSVPSAQVPFVTEPPALAPPVAKPPAPAPPVSVPSAQVPFVTQPPALAPPVAMPPAPAPLVSVPSMQVPLVTQPPALAPPVAKPPAPAPLVSVPSLHVPLVTQPPALAPPVAKPPAPAPLVSVPSAAVPLVTQPPVLTQPIAKPPAPAPPVSVPSAQVPFVTQPPALSPPVAMPHAPAPLVSVPSTQVPLVTQPPALTQPVAKPPAPAPPVSAPSVSVPSAQVPVDTKRPALAPPEVSTPTPIPPFSELPAPAPLVTKPPFPVPQSVLPPAKAPEAVLPLAPPKPPAPFAPPSVGLPESVPPIIETPSPSLEPVHPVVKLKPPVPKPVPTVFPPPVAKPPAPAPPVFVPSAQVPLVTQPPSLAPSVAKPTAPVPPTAKPPPQTLTEVSPPAFPPPPFEPPAPGLPPVELPESLTPFGPPLPLVESSIPLPSDELKEGPSDVVLEPIEKFKLTPKKISVRREPESVYSPPDVPYDSGVIFKKTEVVSPEDGELEYLKQRARKAKVLPRLPVSKDRAPLVPPVSSGDVGDEVEIIDDIRRRVLLKEDQVPVEPLGREISTEDIRSVPLESDAIKRPLKRHWKDMAEAHEEEMPMEGGKDTLLPFVHEPLVDFTAEDLRRRLRRKKKGESGYIIPVEGEELAVGSKKVKPLAGFIYRPIEIYPTEHGLPKVKKTRVRKKEKIKLEDFGGRPFLFHKFVSAIHPKVRYNVKKGYTLDNLDKPHRFVQWEELAKRFPEDFASLESWAHIPTEPASIPERVTEEKFIPPFKEPSYGPYASFHFDPRGQFTWIEHPATLREEDLKNVPLNIQELMYRMTSLLGPDADLGFLFPFVVIRNGELYYKFYGGKTYTENYSLN